MPIDAFINQLVIAEAITPLHHTYTGGHGPKVPNLRERQHLDPYGTLFQVPDSDLRNYNYDALPPEKTVAFFERINLARDQHDPVRAMPAPHAIDPGNLVPRALSHGIPTTQHSIWTGNTLSIAVPKQREFMDSLAKTSRDNPAWTVVLWTDKSRAEMNGALPGSDLGRMRQWAHDNRVVLASIDEVFAGNKAMILHKECRLEQNKAGTGRAATSDIVRLEVLNRFGGVYVDGDKKVLKPLTDITEQAEKNKVRLLLPVGDARGGPGVEPNAKELQAMGQQPRKVVELTGFAVGNEKGKAQNCAFCATKGSLITQRMIETTRDNYGKTRAELMNNGKQVSDHERAQRVEVIVRSGPSMMRDSTSPGSTEQPLMPLGSVKTYTGTTSWTGEKTYSGSKNPIAGLAALGAQPTVAALELAATQLANPPPGLPPDRAALTGAETEAFRKALRGSLTALSYTVVNEGGKLDLNHIKPHLADLTPQDQTLAVHAVVSALTRPQFAGLASKVNNLRLPSGVTVAPETLDTLRTHAAFGGRVDMSQFTVQEAALEGNMAFLRYARDNHLIDLNKRSSIYLDGGMGKVLTSNLEGQGGKLDPVQAAIIGGHSEALHYLMSMPEFANYQHKAGAIELAAKHGQISNVVALAQKWNMPNSLGPVLARLEETLESHVPSTEASRLAPLMENAIEKDPTPPPDPKLAALLNEAVNPATLPPRVQVLNAQIEERLHVLGIPNNDINALKQGGNISAGIRQARNQGPDDTRDRELDLAVTRRTMGRDMLRDFRQRFGPEADLSSASATLLTDAVRRGALAQIPEMIALGVSTAHLSSAQKGDLGMAIQKRAVDGPTCSDMLTLAGTLGVEDDMLIKAAQAQNTKLITESLNRGRPFLNQVIPGDFDIKAELAIAHVRFPNSETGKNAYQNVDAHHLTPATARELVQKAMVYSHDRLRDSQDGKTSRVEGWQRLLAQMQREPALRGDANLMALAADTHDKLGAMITKNLQVRDQYRFQATRQPAPDLSQREATSIKGTVREKFSPSPAPPRSPAGQRFVPGKGMQ